jgi:hypothetical protein
MYCKVKKVQLNFIEIRLFGLAPDRGKDRPTDHTECCLQLLFDRVLIWTRSTEL